MDSIQSSAAGGPTASTASTVPLNHQENTGEESEWEYEYSTTETETYYVTLDLSKPDFIARQQKTVMNGRGGYKEKMFGNIFSNKNDDGEDNDDEDDDHTSRLKDNVDEVDESQADAGDKESGDERADEVQILDLHSGNPIISYKGHVYMGEWARNLGTELLLTRRDEETPLPAVLSLENGMDLLAASCARIATTEKEMKPITSKPRRRRRVMFNEDDYEISEEDSQVDSGMTVPLPEPGAPQARVEQGNFLAKLIALKKQKGEVDDVTVIAQSKESVARRLPQPRPSGNTAGPPAVGRGRGRTRGRGRGRGRARARARGPATGVVVVVSSSASASASDAENSNDESSRPTPANWSELNKSSAGLNPNSDESGGGDGGQEDESEEDDESEVEDDEMEDGGEPQPSDGDEMEIDAD